MKIFFDVQGTLLSTDDQTMRPCVEELLKALNEAGHEVIFWSTAGSGYARNFADRFNLMPWVSGNYSKRDNVGTPDVCVDDNEDYLVGSKANVLVCTYRGEPDDRELETVWEALWEASLLDPPSEGEEK